MGVEDGTVVRVVAARVTVAIGVSTWVDDGKTIGVTGVPVGSGVDVAVVVGAALLQAVNSRTRMSKVSFFIPSIVQRISKLSTPFGYQNIDN